MPVRWPPIGALALVLGCGDGTEPRQTAATTVPPSTRPALPSSTTTVPGMTVPPTTLAPPATPEDGRRILEQHGVDPDELSKDIGEQLRRRFERQPAP